MLTAMLDLSTPEAPAPATSIRIGSATDYVDLHIVDGLLLVQLSGAARIAQVRAALTAMRQTGALTEALPTLVDLSEFSGAIDWAELRAISQMADWVPPGDNRPMPVAYVSGDSLFTMLVKLVQVFFPWARHRAFGRREWALEWLQQQMATRSA